MIDTNKIKIERICMHYVGNKTKEEGLKLSTSTLNIDNHLEEVLVKYFLSSFKQNEYYNFYHDTNLKYNEVYNYVHELFNSHEDIINQSIALAKHLYKKSSHPQIKNGELYVVLFKNCLIDNEVVDAIGIFKSENKDTFLKISPKNEDFEIKSEQGININKLDKGCVVFNSNSDNGYILEIIDNTNKSIGSQAQYWVDDFLQVKRQEDSYFQTQKVLDLCRKFANEKLPLDEENSKINQADFLNKSLSFLKENSNFKFDEFEKKVFQGTKIADDFQQFKEQYQTTNHVDIAEEFDISNVALKKQTTSYQSVLKLDNNFHIYIHGDTSLIQNGIDKNSGMKYYRFLYNEER